jgi:hypothetical protein
MRPTWPYLAAGAFAYVLFLLIKAPASMALAAVEQLPAVHAAAPSGTLWNGRFEQASAGNLDLGRVHWRVRPSRLLLGRLELELQARPLGGNASATLQLRPGQGIDVTDGQGRIPLAPLAPLFALPPNGLAGEGAFVVHRLRWRGQIPARVEADLRIFGLELRVMGNHHLGNYVGSLRTADNGIGGSFSDAGDAPFALQGELSLSPAGAYVIEGHIRARDTAPRELAGALEYLGEADTEGRHRFRFSGNL